MVAPHKINKEGLAPLILRLTYQNKRAEKATGHYVNPKDWNAAKQRLRGNSHNSTLVNEWINEAVVKTFNIVKDEIKDNNGVYLPSILTSLFAEIKEETGLLKLMAEHSDTTKTRRFFTGHTKYFVCPVTYFLCVRGKTEGHTLE